MKVFHIVGTRPNFLKVAPVVVKLAARPSRQRDVDSLRARGWAGALDAARGA